MTFLEALYGSQYYEIQQREKDGNKGRLNGNLFLAALIMLLLFAVVMVLISLMPGFEKSLTKSIRHTFGNNISGASIGRLIAIPLLAFIYFAIIYTVGSKKQFAEKVAAFMQYPDEVKKKANAKLLIPFFLLLIVAVVLAIAKL
jgi:hypothetical protein